MHIVIKTKAGQHDKFTLPETVTYREMKEIRTISGYKPAELEQALAGGDGDLMVALAVIAAKREGITLNPDQLMGLDFGDITVEPDEEDEATPTEAADAAALEQPNNPTIHVDGGAQPS